MSYTFLAKPKDDLRRDNRLMEFNSMLNKLFLRDSEGRKRNLFIKTYVAMPLNEECGIIEWVHNTACMRNLIAEFGNNKNKIKNKIKIKNKFKIN